MGTARDLTARRVDVARALGVAGLAAYNWWLPVAVHGSLLTTPHELFSDLTATGRPWAGALGGLDVTAGVLLLASVTLLGPGNPDGPGGPGGPAARPARRWLLLFAAACAVGGLFPYVCAEGLDAACRTAEWHLRLPWRHYVHVVAGIVEFGAGSAAVLLGARRSALRGATLRGATLRDAALRSTRRAALALLALGYPLLAASYLTDVLGALVEPLFFVAFSLAVAAELLTGPAADQDVRIRPPGRPSLPGTAGGGRSMPG